MIPEHGELHLHLGDTEPLVDVIGQPVVLVHQHGVGLEVLHGGTPPVAPAQQADKERPAPFYLVETQLQNLTRFRLFLRNTPSEVNGSQGYHTLSGKSSEFREGLLHQDISFGLHVTESRGYEHRHLPVEDIVFHLSGLIILMFTLIVLGLKTSFLPRVWLRSGCS